MFMNMPGQKKTSLAFTFNLCKKKVLSFSIKKIGPVNRFSDIQNLTEKSDRILCDILSK